MPVLQAETKQPELPFLWKRTAIALLLTLPCLFLLGVFLRLLGFTELSLSFGGYLSVFLIPFFCHLANGRLNEEGAHEPWTSQLMWALKFGCIVGPVLAVMCLSFCGIYNYLV